MRRAVTAILSETIIIGTGVGVTVAFPEWSPWSWFAVAAAATIALIMVLMGDRLFPWRVSVVRKTQMHTHDPALGYADAIILVDRYIEPATRDMTAGARLAVRHDFLDRFSKTPGAMLGEGQYNRARLRQWIESNAARFLVDHRKEMR